MAQNDTALCKKYVDYSNKHQIDQIAPMFDENAIYTSSVVGSFKGKEAIVNMTRDFFTKNPDVFWNVSKYETVTDRPHGIFFDFVRTGTGSDGSPIRKEGREWVYFNAGGKIVEVVVQAK